MKHFHLIFVFLIFCQSSFSQFDKGIQGYWLQEGYGVYLEISETTYKMYDVTQISCQPSSSSALNDWTGSLETLFDLYKIEETDEVSMILKYGITRYKFNKLKEPLALCENPIFSSKDPKLNFNVLWHTFKENYAYSALRGVDWDKIYRDHIHLITENTTEVELYGYIGEILDAIQDEHISLRVPKDISEAYLKIRELKKEESEPSDNEKEVSDSNKEYDYTSLRSNALENILKLYNTNNFKRYHKDLLIWGKLKKEVGYIQINSMNGYSQDVYVAESYNSNEYWDKHWEKVFDDIKKGKTLGQYLRGERKGVKVMMDSIITQLSDTPNLIIDLRFNPGGTDQVAMDILSYFTTNKTNIFTKKIWTGVENSFESKVYVESSDKLYQGKVVLLMGSQTGSSAEAMVLGSLGFKNIIRIGSNTMGIFSDVLQKKLPNGWSFGLSNEIYESSNNKNYEYVGITPDFLIPYSREWVTFHKSMVMLNDKDPAIEKAFSIFNK
ncbi:S41 family peptidase [Aquimarina algiphila]|uniref:S41 family peptidase n=1 Tax=Aquimarina algiphila TaxID=2047982 RepID=A0A554VHE4_9FLAO|nr:S41 family peptidase [Aquimarina algiphila]TSE06915.1 S41 family peptidase [Aquimarina algiphila]